MKEPMVLGLVTWHFFLFLFPQMFEKAMVYIPESVSYFDCLRIAIMNPKEPAW
jgi:hypothetical protein